MIRLLALASLLVLLPLPLASAAALATRAPASEQGSGMAARPHFVIEAGVRVPAATSASLDPRLALPEAVVDGAPPSAARGWPDVPLATYGPPSLRLVRLGRLLLDGG